MGNDAIYMFWWWLTFLIIGVISIPTVWFFFKRFIDIGYGFAKIIGLLLISYAAFLGGILHVIPFTNFTLYLIFFVYTAINFKIFLKYRQKIHSHILKKIRIIASQEILFILGLLLWSYIRAHQPDIRGLEKFMDLGFINSILRSKYLPPVDMWFANQPINYYWFGHFVVGVATKLSNIPSTITYNLMLATILGFSLTSVFSLVATIYKKTSKNTKIKSAIFAGLVSAVLLNFGGNFHTPYYVLKDGADKYWYPDATRFIGYNPEVDDKTIHEFPLYSYVVSDLHAHLINLPFVLLFIALLWNLISSNDKNSKHEARSTKQYQNSNFPNSKLFNKLGFSTWNLFRISDLEFRISKLLPLGFLLGIFFMTNAWDFGNYLLTAGVVIGLINIKKSGITLKTIVNTAIPIGAIILIGALTVFPFVMNFESIAQGVDFVHTHTPLWQLAILWGFPITLTIIFVTFLSKRVKRLKTSDLFVLSLLVVSWILITIPEIIFVKDIYIASHYRANTMFKLTYQAFVMFYLSSGYIAIRVIFWLNKSSLKLITIMFFGLIFFLLLIYPTLAVNSYYGDLKIYRGLAGDTWLKTQLPEQYEVIEWFNQNIKGQPVILEAPGDSYTDFNVISSYTGLPTVSGWFVHEWLWRGGSSFPQTRVADITQIYTSTDLEQTQQLLSKYNLEYIIIGPQERQKFPSVYEEKFEELGEVVFRTGNTKVYKTK